MRAIGFQSLAALSLANSVRSFQDPGPRTQNPENGLDTVHQSAQPGRSQQVAHVLPALRRLRRNVKLTTGVFNLGGCRCSDGRHRLTGKRHRAVKRLARVNDLSCSCRREDHDREAEAPYIHQVSPWYFSSPCQSQILAALEAFTVQRPCTCPSEIVRFG